jgi:flagellar M-ring protein FliF
MAANRFENVAAAAQGFGSLPIVRQLALLVGLAASIAIGGAVVMWSQQPSFQILYGGLADKDASEVVGALQKANIPVKIDDKTGAIMVPPGKVHDARLKLATQGLPKGGGTGFELMEKEQGFGTSQFVEAARYQRALEGELARTIATISNVESARVHLALPKQSVFVRNRQKPSASVVVNLYAGRSLDDEQVAGIVNLVASSIPNLEADGVTVIDQKGHMLSMPGKARELALSASQFDYTQRVEAAYAKRIEDLLTPVVGIGGVRAQVVADIDFTVKEQTQESFNPDKTALRSEQTSEEQSIGYNLAAGIPGALSNQPPGTAAAPEQAAPPAAGGEAPAVAAANAATETPSSHSRRATTNYELDKTISHTRMASGTVRRLSVAVVVDDKQTAAGGGERQPYTEGEIKRLTSLVKEAVGFDEQRGDSVQVINASFVQPEVPEPLPEPPLWEKPWVWDLGKQVLSGLLVLILIFTVLRPVLRSLAEKGREPRVMFAGAGAGALPGGGEAPAALGAPSPAPAAASSYDEDLSTTRSLVAQDPKRVAQVVKTWVNSDGG